MEISNFYDGLVREVDTTIILPFIVIDLDDIVYSWNESDLITLTSK